MPDITYIRDANEIAQNIIDSVSNPDTNPYTDNIPARAYASAVRFAAVHRELGNNDAANDYDRAAKVIKRRYNLK